MKNLINDIAYVIIAVLLLGVVSKAIANPFTTEKCEVYFSPKGGIERRIIEHIDATTSHIAILSYSFTSKPITEAIIKAHRRGVKVEMVIDKSNLTSTQSTFDVLKENNIPVWVDYKHQIQHNKVMVFDAKIFKTGSFNYSASAESRNAENALFCKSTEGASKYLADFRKHQEHSEYAK